MKLGEQQGDALLCNMVTELALFEELLPKLYRAKAFARDLDFYLG